MAKNSIKTHEVNALRMPGFNAEASLYGSPVVYHSSVGSGRTIGTVQPANVCLCCDPFGCERCPCKIATHWPS